ncbi:hypothetical protein AA15973_1371 [Komagataeibacter sucrofermentans DSM 15973]|nr:hypothetical protein AA15973_1371 [Komagataeibacter sucrofermentans DSM 15973]
MVPMMRHTLLETSAPTVGLATIMTVVTELMGDWSWNEKARNSAIPTESSARALNAAVVRVAAHWASSEKMRFRLDNIGRKTPGSGVGAT